MWFRCLKFKSHVDVVLVAIPRCLLFPNFHNIKRMHFAEPECSTSVGKNGLSVEDRTLLRVVACQNRGPPAMHLSGLAIQLEVDFGS
jgi:hypothetical protein